MSGKQAHTAGPWRQDGCCIVSDSGEIGRVHSWASEMHGAWEANARLIAASPALLKAAEGVLPIMSMLAEGFWEDCPFPDVQKRRYAALKAAVAKARPTPSETE